MPGINAMSNDQIRAQSEQITRIESTADAMKSRIDKMYKWGGIGIFFLGCIVGFASTIIKGYVWEQSIVKQPQFEQFANKVFKADSGITAKMDTGFYRANKRIDSIPRYRIVNATQHKDKNGNIFYKSIN